MKKNCVPSFIVFLKFSEFDETFSVLRLDSLVFCKTFKFVLVPDDYQRFFKQIIFLAGDAYF